MVGSLCKGPHLGLQKQMYVPGPRHQTSDVLGVLMDLLVVLDAHFVGAIASNYPRPLVIAAEAFGAVAAVVRGNAEAVEALVECKTDIIPNYFAHCEYDGLMTEHKARVREAILELCACVCALSPQEVALPKTWCVWPVVAVTMPSTTRGKF